MQAEIWHYGIKGQKKGQRRFQNEDGSYTEEGRRRYGIGDGDFVTTRKQEPPKGSKTGPYGAFDYKDPNQRMKETSKKIKTAIKESRDLKNVIVPEKAKKSSVQTMIDIGKETEKDKEDKRILKEQLKAGYKQRLGSALSSGFGGWALNRLGGIVGLTSHKFTASLLSITGKLMIGSAAFKAAVSTGAYFVGKNMVDDGRIKRKA